MTDTTHDHSLADNVRYGHGLGWSFTPLRGKRPTLNGWQRRERESLDEALAWASRGNVGLRTGQTSGVVVIDADAGADLSPLDLPGTVTVNTGKDGLHLYYRTSAEIGNSAGKLGAHIDTRGNGGQVVYPGSIHPDTGRRYEWAEGFEPWNTELAELPAHVVELLESSRRPGAAIRRAQQQAERVDRYVAAALRRETDAVATAREGARNEQLNRSAFSLGQLVGGGYLQRESVEGALRDAASIAGLGWAEAMATVRSGIESGIRDPRTIETRTSEPVAPDGGAMRRAEYILIPGAHVDDAGRYVEQGCDDFADAVIGALPVDLVYRRTDRAPGLIVGDLGKRRWDALRKHAARALIDARLRLGRWRTSRKTGEQAMHYQPCSIDCASIVLDCARTHERIRDLRLMVSYPIYGPGWERVEPGWHDGLYYDEPPDLRGVEPERDCEVIHNVLHDLTIDFPFKCAADWQNFVGLLLTPIVAPAIDGNRPFHAITASLERTGKTKLAEEVWGGVILGRQTPALQITEREEERDKRVVALLLRGETMVHLDNLPPRLDSVSLASLLTTATYQGRILGASQIVDLPNHLTVVGSGNNIQTTGEIGKRTVPIEIQPRDAHPESRRNFQHPNLRAYVRRQRKLVISCLLGLVENWLTAGRPSCPNTLGSFEDWSHVIGGILQVNALTQWRTNEREWRALANPASNELESFVRSWYATYGLAESPVEELRLLAQGLGVFGDIFARRSPQAVAVAFGKFLRRHVNTPVAEWFIRYRSTSHRPLYRLESVL